MDFTTCRRQWLLGGTAILLCQGFGGAAQAYEYTFNDGIKVQIQNTLQYSVLERTAPESPYLAGEINNNDGDNNLRAGIVSNRFDLLSKLDVSDNGFGIDVSADSFYDSVYNQNTQNGDAATYNPATQPVNKFTSETEAASGRNIELRNLFAYGTQTIDGVPVTLRVGRLVNIFGESLFFASNGIAYGNAPLDVARAEAVPNTQAKDLFLPVGQVNLSAQLTDTISAILYYQFEWEKYDFAPSGSYFSTVDLLGEGAQRLIASPPVAPFAPGVYFYRGRDISGADTGQFGLAVHYDPSDAPYDLGFYALQYNDSEPQVYTRPHYVFIHGVPTVVPTPVAGNPAALSLGTYQLVYPDHIQIYGISGSTTIGPTNIAGEISARTNEPLVSSVTLAPGQVADNNGNPLYATGNTLHYQASAVYLGPGGKYWDASNILFEAAGDNLLGFTKNRENFNPAYRHMALGLRTIASLTYYNALPGLDLTPNIGLGWNFMGLAPDTEGFNNTGIDRGGDITIALSAAFLVKWTGGIAYTRYVAPAGRDPYADRDFASFDIERTF
jgi:hypothetical protein